MVIEKTIPKLSLKMEEGTIVEKPVIENQFVFLSNTMNAQLAADDRVVDGALAEDRGKISVNLDQIL